MGKKIQFLALSCALMGSHAHALNGDNPFDKTERIFAGAGNDWVVVDDMLRKSSANESGTWYHLEMNRESMRLVMTSSGDIGAGKNFKALVIEDMKVDGRRMPVFSWCLQNQDNHHRFLQQGLKVKLDICQNRGETGEFQVKVNKQTMESLEQGKRLSFTIKPFRSSIEVNFDIEKIADAFAVIDMENIEPVVAAAPVIAPVKAAPIPAAPVPKVVKQTLKFCDAKAPAGFTGIKSVQYVCDDARDRKQAENKISRAVDKEKQRRAQVAAQQEQERLAALEAKRQQEEELLRRQQEEQEAIAASQEKHQIVLDELTQKMLGVCNKMWGLGKHRCYCEKYIEHAPSSIQSDPSCSS